MCADREIRYFDQKPFFLNQAVNVFIFLLMHVVSVVSAASIKRTLHELQFSPLLPRLHILKVVLVI